MLSGVIVVTVMPTSVNPGANRAVAVTSSAQSVMALIEDQQGVLVPERFGVDGGAVIGGHQQRGAVVRTAAEQPHGRIREGRQEMRIPLVQEVQRRHHDQRALLGFLEGELRQVGLPSACGQHDHPLAPRSEPGRQRRALMRVGRHLKRRHEGERPKRLRLVHERRALCPERLDEAPIVQGREAKALHPIIPGRIRDPGFPRRRGVHQQGATVERERRSASHVTCSAVTRALVVMV
jgi:hypothetical protein